MRLLRTSAMTTLLLLQLVGRRGRSSSTVQAFSITRGGTAPTTRQLGRTSSSYFERTHSFSRLRPLSSSTSQQEGESAVSTSVTTTTVNIPKKFNPKPFDYHQELTIRIESLTNMGWGVGRVTLETSIDDEDEDDEEEERLWVIMVPHVVVGELCKVRIFRNQKQYSEADLVEIVEASPHRVTPQCSLAGLCGGCQYQHMSIEAQRDWKTKHVQEVLFQQKIEGYSSSPESLPVLPTMGTEHVYHYRSKITPHYNPPREVGLDTFAIDAIGFQQSSNRNLVDVPECPIATHAINDKYRQVRATLLEQAKAGTLPQPKKKKKKHMRGSRNSSGVGGATLLFRQADDNIETGESVVITDHNEYMNTTVKGITFQYLAGNFFQNNNHVVPLMVDAVVNAAIQPSPTTGTPPSYLIDCYCGSGLFALSAASKFNLVVGIEVNDRAIAEATTNAQLNDISNCQFMAASAEAIFTSPPTITLPGFEEERVQEFPRDQTVVVLDPPRKGCSPEFLEQLYEYSPQRIVYMSCGPATQARDAKGIVEVGGYEIVSTQPFDLFPQTKHIECLMIFEKKVTTV